MSYAKTTKRTVNSKEWNILTLSLKTVCLKDVSVLITKSSLAFTGV